MRKVLSMMALAVAISFGTGVVALQVGAQMPSPAPSPTDEKDKDKNRAVHARATRRATARRKTSATAARLVVVWQRGMGTTMPRTLLSCVEASFPSYCARRHSHL